MSTPATRTTDGSAGGSTAGTQSVRLASGGTAGGGSGTTTAGTVLTVAGSHVPILKLTVSLPAPTGEVPNFFRGVTLEDQRNQATEIYDFLNTPSPALARLDEGAKCYAALVNVLKKYLVK